MTVTSKPDEHIIREHLTAAVKLAGYEVSELELMRIGNNYVYADRGHGRVFRVSLRERDTDRLTSENLRISRLVESGAPLLGPTQVEPVELEGTGYLATIWPLGCKPEPIPAESLAPTLAVLHRVAAMPDLPTWAGFERGWYRLDLARRVNVPSELVNEVEGKLDDLEHSFPAWSTATVVHGDPHTGNLVQLDGRHLLIDLDDLALGCPEIDLAPVCCSYRRFEAVPGDWEGYAAAYGGALDEDLLDWFVQLRQLTMIAWLFTLWDVRPESHTEAAHRVNTLDKVAKWNPL